MLRYVSACVYVRVRVRVRVRVNMRVCPHACIQMVEDFMANPHLPVSPRLKQGPLVIPEALQAKCRAWILEEDKEGVPHIIRVAEQGSSVLLDLFLSLEEGVRAAVHKRDGHNLSAYFYAVRNNWAEVSRKLFDVMFVEEDMEM
jgi:hypothetical protein